MRVKRARLAGLLAFVALAGAVGGCGSGGSSSSSSGSTGTEKLVSYHRSGGLAYSNITLTVDSDGHAVATASGPTGSNTKSVTLSPSQVVNLRKVLDAAPLSGLPRRTKLGCADCYQYQFEYGGDSYSTDEASVPSSLKPVIDALDPIAARAIPRNIVPSLSG